MLFTSGAVESLSSAQIESAIREMNDSTTKKKRDSKDLSRLLERLGIDGRIASVCFPLIDVDASGFVDMEEITSFLRKLVGIKLNEQHSLDHILYLIVDRNGDGSVDAKEIFRACWVMNYSVDLPTIEKFLAETSGGTCSFDLFCQFRVKLDAAPEYSPSWSASRKSEAEGIWSQGRAKDAVAKLRARGKRVVFENGHLLGAVLSEFGIPFRIGDSLYQLLRDEKGIVDGVDVADFLNRIVGVSLQDSRCVQLMLFRVADRDGSGSIDAVEACKFGNALKMNVSVEAIDRYLASHGLTRLDFDQCLALWQNAGSLGGSRVWSERDGMVALSRFYKSGDCPVDEFYGAMAMFRIPEAIYASFLRILGSDGTTTIKQAAVRHFFMSLVGVDLDDPHAFRRVLFNYLDADGNGVLDPKEIGTYFTAMGQTADISAFEAHFRAKGSAGFSYAEFVSWLFGAR